MATAGQQQHQQQFKGGFLSSRLAVHFGQYKGLEICLNIYPTRP